MKQVFGLLLGILMMFSSAVFADEAKSTNYSGFYLGALASNTDVSGDWEIQPAWKKRGFSPFSIGLDADGLQGGVVAGYSWDVGRPNAWVVGAEVDFFAGGVNGDNALPYVEGRYVLDRGIDSMSISNQITLRGRIGYDMNGFMPYVAAGGTCADVTTFSSHWMFEQHSSSGIQCGPAVAVGAELMFGKNNGWSGRIEHRRTDFGLLETEQTIFGVVKNF